MAAEVPENTRRSLTNAEIQRFPDFILFAE